MNNIVPTSGQGREIARPSVGSTGRHLDDVSWDGEVLDLDSVGLAIDHDPAEIIASAVVDEGLALRRTDGTYRRRRIGWVADRSGVSFVLHAQRLTRRSDGKLLAAGGYGPEVSRRHHASEPVMRRTGDVPADATEEQADTAKHSISSSSHPESRMATFRQGHEALAFLPSVVRRGVLSRINDPLWFTGQALRWNDGDSFTVDLLRLDASGALALRASTHRDTQLWRVDQVVYTFETDDSVNRRHLKGPRPHA